MPKKNIKIQELRLIHMALTAMKKNINMQIDEMQVRIEMFLPSREGRHLTAKEMEEIMMSS